MFQIELILRLVSEGKLCRLQKNTYQDLQGKVGHVLSWGKVCNADAECLCQAVRPGDALIKCIADKVTHVVSDKASNMVKGFKLPGYNANSYSDDTSDTDGSSDTELDDIKDTSQLDLATDIL